MLTFEEPQSGPPSASGDKAAKRGKGKGGGGAAAAAAPSPWKPVHLEALEALGIARSRVIHGWARARVAHMPDGVLCAHPSPLGLVLAREAIRSAVGLPAVPPFADAASPPPPPPPLPLPGMDAGMTPASVRGCLLGRSPPFRVLLPKRVSQRAMRNFEALREGLLALPAEVTVLADDALPHQADVWRAFGRADAVVSQNGAALANMLAMAPGAAVFEVAQFHHMSFHFAHMAAALGLPLHQYVTDTTRWQAVDAPVERILRDVCDFGLGRPPREAY